MMRQPYLSAPLRILGAAWLGEVVSGVASASLRGRDVTIPDWGGPVWGGRSFDDSPLGSSNAWADTPHAPMVDNLYPTAPLDRVDKAWIDSVSGAAPLAPGQRASGSTNNRSPMPPDYIPAYSHPRVFPGDAREKTSALPEGSTLTPIDEQQVIATPDTLRPTIGTWRNYQSRLNPLPNYPNMAPADRSGWPNEQAVAAGDRIPEEYARYINQAWDREATRRAAVHVNKMVEKTDVSKDGAISPDEYKGELQGRQNKSEAEAQQLWDKFQTSKDKVDMSTGAFKRLVQAGFDLGRINRTDISTVLTPPHTAARGFWGSGAACPSGKYLTGVRLKQMPSVANAAVDNTGLNAVGIRCDDGSEISTVEGPDGEWGPYIDCPKGQRVYGFRSSSAEVRPGRDNTGISDMEFSCRMPDLTAFSRLRMTSTNPALPAGVSLGNKPTATGLGWSPDLTCPPKQALCGFQANVLRGEGEGRDNMGVTSIRGYCCNAPVDCTKVCAANQAATVKCRVCLQAAGMK